VSRQGARHNSVGRIGQREKVCGRNRVLSQVKDLDKLVCGDDDTVDSVGDPLDRHDMEARVLVRHVEVVAVQNSPRLRVEGADLDLACSSLGETILYFYC